MMVEAFKRQWWVLESLMIQVLLKFTWRGMWSHWEFGFMVFVSRLFVGGYSCSPLPSQLNSILFILHLSHKHAAQRQTNDKKSVLFRVVPSSVFPVFVCLFLCFALLCCFSDSTRFFLVMLFLHLLAPNRLPLPFLLPKNCRKYPALKECILLWLFPFSITWFII